MWYGRTHGRTHARTHARTHGPDSKIPLRKEMKWNNNVWSSCNNSKISWHGCYLDYPFITYWRWSMHIITEFPLLSIRLYSKASIVADDSGRESGTITLDLGSPFMGLHLPVSQLESMCIECNIYMYMYVLVVCKHCASGQDIKKWNCILDY